MNCDACFNEIKKNIELKKTIKNIGKLPELIDLKN